MRPLERIFAVALPSVLLALAVPACAHLPALLLSGDEITGPGSGQPSDDPQAVKTSKAPAPRDRGLTLLGNRVSFAVAPGWQIEQQEYSKRRGLVEVSIPPPRGASANSPAASASVIGELAGADSRIESARDDFTRDLSILSDAPDGPAWRTIVGQTRDGAFLRLGRLGLVAGVAVRFVLSIPSAPGTDTRWIAQLVRDFNRLGCQLRIDDGNHCEVLVTVDKK